MRDTCLYPPLTGQVVGLLHCDQHVQANPSHWLCHDRAQWYVYLCFSLKINERIEKTTKAREPLNFLVRK